MRSKDFIGRVLLSVAVAVVVGLVGPLAWKTPSEKRRDEETRKRQEEIARDLEQLRRLECAANGQGTAAGQVAMGLKFAGTGDFARAATLFERAAEAGEPLAASALADIYAQEHLADPDHVRAYKWYSIACDDAARFHTDPSSDGCQRRDQMAGNLRATDLARARAQASAWQARYRK
jgi:localization factor PodJL